MDDSVRNATADVVTESSARADASITLLNTAGANRFDPLGQHYLSVLASRLKMHQGPVRLLLEQKLAQAMTLFTERFDVAQTEAKMAIVDTLVTHPHLAETLQIFYAANDFTGLKQCIRNKAKGSQPTPLGELLRRFEWHTVDRMETDAGLYGGLHTELKSGLKSEFKPEFKPELKVVRSSKKTWSTLSASRQVTRALEQAPKNAGPINSHMLVLRSLALMREVSPDYLGRFMSYADTLLYLDQEGKEKPVHPKKKSSTKLAK